LASGLIDWALIFTLSFTIAAVLYRLGISPASDVWVLSARSFWVLFILYPALCWLPGGATAGDLALGIGLRDEEGYSMRETSMLRRITMWFGAYFGRNFCRIGPRWAGRGELYIFGTVAAAVLLLVSLMALPTSTGTPTTISSSAPQSGPLGWGVFICLRSDLDVQQGTCTDNESTVNVSDLAQTVLSVTGQDGSNFTNTTLTAIVSDFDAAGTMHSIGNASLTVQTTNSAEYWPLSAVLQAASVTLQANTTYDIEVDQGSTGSADKLGGVGFTVQQ
jgi:hypothetical protein